MDDYSEEDETKGQQVKRMVEEGFSSVQRESLRVEIVKDRPGFTKIRIVRKMKERTDGEKVSPA
jgi:hypothetical protein